MFHREQSLQQSPDDQLDRRWGRLCRRMYTMLCVTRSELEVECRLAAEVRARRDELVRENERLSGELATAQQDLKDLREQLRLVCSQAIACA